jgi:diphthine methyl ester acylhydrolase
MGRQLFQELTFDFPTDSVEFSRVPNERTLAVGMYQLEDSQVGKRIGAVSFLRNDNDDKDFIEFSRLQLNGGLLDMKWIGETPFLVAATSCEISIIDSDKISKTLGSDNPLYLSVDLLGNMCLSTGSTGTCNLYDLTLGKEISSWKAHNLEAWCGAFQDENIFFTGADDSTLKSWDIRASFSNPLLVNKSHQAGVCSIVPLPPKYLLVTGSYDNYLRFFDLRNLSRPVRETKFGSGVWRIKHFQDKLLLACMNDGFRVVDIANDSIDCEFHTPSGSLAYGCSWSEDSFIACASFYDCKVGIWRDSE